MHKLNNVGWFIKCKARFIIKGDQYKRTNGAEMYGAILVKKNFKILLAIIIKFNLELY